MEILQFCTRPSKCCHWQTISLRRWHISWLTQDYRPFFVVLLTTFLQQVWDIIDVYLSTWGNLKMITSYWIWVFLKTLCMKRHLWTYGQNMLMKFLRVYWYAPEYWRNDKMTSSNWNIFRVPGPLCGEITGHQWILLTKANDAELWCFLWSALNKLFSKHSRRRWFETLSIPLWRQCNV